jgi:antitoxin HicB
MRESSGFIDRYAAFDRMYLRRSTTVANQFSFSVVLEPQQDGGFTVLVPALPEVVTEGDSEQEALANAEEAIRAVLSYRRDHGLAIPADAHPEIRRVTVAA